MKNKDSIDNLRSESYQSGSYLDVFNLLYVHKERENKKHEVKKFKEHALTLGQKKYRT